MSTGGAQVAVLGRRGRLVSEPPASLPGAHPHLVRVIAFAVLGLYGIIRWSRLLAAGTHGRLVAILALAVLLAGARPVIARWSRAAAGLFTAAVLLAAFPVAGVPLHWMLHLRIAVIADAIGGGISTLPQTLVPYMGSDQWVRLDIVLGAAVLLFDAALLLAFAPRTMDDLRRAGAALPLIALIAVPSALMHPHFPYLNGVLVFLMLAAFVLGDRVSASRGPSAAGLCLLAAAAAMLIAPGLDRHTFWLNPATLAGSPAPRPAEVFNWTQTYGPVNWPHQGHTVLEVRARQPEYWKAEDLDVFDMRGWTEGVVPGQENIPAPAPSDVARWSQTIGVTVRDMRSGDVIGAGTSGQPSHVSQPVAGYSAGTWTTGAQLKTGDSYSIRVYSPHPTEAQLSSDHGSYADIPAGYRTIIIPAPAQPGGAPAAQVVFPPFHSRAAVENVIGLPVSQGAAVIRHSPYARTYALARRLARGASTPYAFARSIERFLGHGFTYTQQPPLRAYPLESFLFADKRGYCQQFAGAMALLLRMGGVPARVAVGFTQGRRDPATDHWLISDQDAHAWVEVWFPHLGWVKFDPTPPVDPALKNQPALASAPGAASSGSAAQNNRNGAVKVPSRTGTARAGAGHRGSGSALWEGLAAAAAVLLALLVRLWLATRPLRSTEDLLAELERALARTGQPLAAPDTLAGLEASLRTSPAAGQYVRTLRLARFGGGEATPTPAQRRALRRCLALRSGFLGSLRALWALPPRRAPATDSAPRSGA